MILSCRGDGSGKHGRQTKGMNDEDENRKTSVSNGWSQRRKSFSQLAQAQATRVSAGDLAWESVGRSGGASPDGPPRAPTTQPCAPVLCLHVSARFLPSRVETGGRGQV